MATAAEEALFTRKPRVIWYQTFEVHHPQMGTRRFVRNQRLAKTFTLEPDAPRNAGQEVSFEPASGSISEVYQSNNPTSSIEVQLGRVGQRIKQELAKINGTGWLQPIEFIYRSYTSTDTSSPLNNPISLVIGNVSMNHDVVSMTAEDDNPSGSIVAVKYFSDDFPGLAVEI